MEEKEYWTETSRYGSLREFTFYPPNYIEVICHEVMYTNFGGSIKYITSIDPDGGPYLCNGKTIKSYKIVKIISYENVPSEKLKILLQVQKV
jgi:hypothetical protein